MIESLKKYRQDLHQIPELAFDLFLTSAYLKKELESMGYQTETVAQTGIIAVRKGSSAEAIAFRSDMDALPVEEKTAVSFQSRHPFKMHACGHDGHLAMLLGFASYIAALPALKKTVVLIFQPAEEGPGGAKVIIESGLFDKYQITSIYGIHLYPGLKEGQYGLVDGPMLAQNGEFNLKITGKSAHAAQPHLGHDAILAASELIHLYHQIISRMIDPLEHAVITVGTIQGGEARNIIANEVKISGTIRSFNDAVYQKLKDQMRNIDRGIEELYDVHVENDIMDYYPPVINDHHLFETLKQDLDPSMFTIIRPMMFAEDFAFYQKVVPGLFIMLGTRNEVKGYIHPLHSCYFNFDESVLIKGVEHYIRISKLMKIF